ncbi:BA14K family protein [Sulfitobacter sp. 20_GPM-1509m]|nr:BA14K family protein [Sulfitobacter sp. 20_GPM-1509m]
MFRKTILKTTALAILTATVAASAASASDYGYGHKKQQSYNQGYSGQNHGYKNPFSHIQDRVWNQHVGWCFDRFKSYNAHDNSYQPYNGPRAQCWSPYISG